MANPIQRIIQLILDRASADKTERDAKKTLSGIDHALDSIRKTAVRLATGLAAAFALRAISAFGRAAVKEAAASEVVWKNLEGTVESIGVAWETVEAKYRSAAEAFQDATTFDDDAFAEGAARIIALTGDETAGIQAMGLAANVAARFFKGQLEPAVDLVGRVLTGQTRQLRQLGIVTKDANEGLRILAERTLNAATERAATFTGRTEQLSNAWNDLKKAIGFALIEAGGGTSVLDTLIGTVRGLTRYMEENRGILKKWVDGIKTAAAPIIALTDLLRALANLIGGVFAGVMAAGTRGVAIWTKAVALGYEIGGKFRGLFDKEAAARIHAETVRLNQQADALIKLADEYEKTAQARLKASAKLSTRTSLGGGRPRGLEKDTDIPLGQSLDEILGGLKAKNLQEQDTAAAKLAARHKELMGLTVKREFETVKLTGSLQRMAEQEAAAASVMMQYGTEVNSILTLQALLGDQFNALESEEMALLSAMQNLADQGIDPMDERMQVLVQRLGEVQEGLKRMQDEAWLSAEIASAAGEIIGAAFGRGIPELAAAKAKQNAILAAEEAAHGLAAIAGLFTAAKAPLHFAAAARYAAIATAWGGLAAATGGFSGGGGLRGGGGTSGVARDVGGRSSERAQAPGAEVHIHFEGEGFDAVNPRVQRVVAGATQLAKERYGENAKIMIHRSR